MHYLNPRTHGKTFRTSHNPVRVPFECSTLAPRICHPPFRKRRVRVPTLTFNCSMPHSCKKLLRCFVTFALHHPAPYCKFVETWNMGVAPTTRKYMTKMWIFCQPRRFPEGIVPIVQSHGSRRICALSVSLTVNHIGVVLYFCVTSIRSVCIPLSINSTRTAPSAGEPSLYKCLYYSLNCLHVRMT